MSADATFKTLETALAKALAKAKDRLAKPEPGDDKKPKPGAKPGDKPGDDDKPEFLKSAGKLKGVADRLAETATKLNESGKAPDAGTMRKLRAMANEVTSALDAYPASKRTMKSASMTPEEFVDHAAAEIERAVSDQDIERLEQVATSFESVTHQIADAGVEKVRVDVFEDPSQHKTETVGGGDALRAITDKIGELAESIQSLKAKKPPKGDEADLADGDDKDKDGKADTDKADGDKDDANKQGVQCPECKTMNKEGATECVKCGAALAKADTKKSDDDPPAWPIDMNQGRKLSEAERWGSVQKSASDDDRSFGPDPSE